MVTDHTIFNPPLQGRELRGSRRNRRSQSGYFSTALDSVLWYGVYNVCQQEMTMKTLRSGELARLAHVNVETLRFYERQGLLAMPARRASGYREYPVEAVKRVA